VYGWEPGRARPESRAQREVLDADLQKLVQRIADRVLRALRKAGKWVDADAAAVEGRAALGKRAGQRHGRVGRDGRWELVVARWVRRVAEEAGGAAGAGAAAGSAW
jgi:hypothetical protein